MKKTIEKLLIISRRTAFLVHVQNTALQKSENVPSSANVTQRNVPLRLKNKLKPMFCRKHFCFLTFRKTLIRRVRRRFSTFETVNLRFGRDRTQNISRTATQHPGLFERRVESGAEQHFPERRRCAHRMFI